MTQDEEYIRYDPFEGDRDVDIKCRTVRVVKTRKPNQCIGIEGRDSIHDMPVGTRARYEHALVDGEWGQWYMCCECMDKWFEIAGITPAK